MLKKILILKTNNTLIQLFRYGFVGGTAFVVDFSVLYLLTEYLNVYYLLSATISFILGILVNYVMSIIWVFKYRNFSKKIYEIAIFIIIGVLGLGLNLVIMWFCTEILFIYYIYSKIISTVIVFLWNFFARKFILFSNG
jgi:putative flippase GtrA